MEARAGLCDRQNSELDGGPDGAVFWSLSWEGGGLGAKACARGGRYLFCGREGMVKLWARGGSLKSWAARALAAVRRMARECIGIVLGENFSVLSGDFWIFLVNGDGVRLRVCTLPAVSAGLEGTCVA